MPSEPCQAFCRADREGPRNDQASGSTKVSSSVRFNPLYASIRAGLAKRTGWLAACKPSTNQIPIEGRFHSDGFQLRAIRVERLQDHRQVGGQTPTVDRLALLVDKTTVHIAFVQVQACV
jgi:hypothetical protein